MPVVSATLPTYNHAHFLPYALQIVLEQTLHDFEVIIVDDGSTDNTREVVQQYPDQRVHYTYLTNRDLAASRNTGIRASSGEYLAFLDADDIFLYLVQRAVLVVMNNAPLRMLNRVIWAILWHSLRHTSPLFHTHE